MNKAEICKKALEDVAVATKMEHFSFNPETRKREMESFDVSDLAKKSAMEAINKFMNSDTEKMLIYHGQDESADYLYYLEISEGELVLTVNTDYGMQMHNSYYRIGEILYRFDELERIKSNLTTIDSDSNSKQL